MVVVAVAGVAAAGLRLLELPHLHVGDHGLEELPPDQVAAAVAAAAAVALLLLVDDDVLGDLVLIHRLTTLNVPLRQAFLKEPSY